MRKLLFTVILFWSFTANAQQEEKMHGILPMQNGKICYSEVVEVPGVSKDDLYIRAYSWFATTYKSAKDVIQMEDKDAGKIIGKGWFSHPFSKLKVDHTITITVKDGRYKYTATDFVFNDKILIGGIMNTVNKTMEETYQKLNPEKKINAKNMNLFNDYVNGMARTVKEAMNKTASENEDDNW